MICWQLVIFVTLIGLTFSIMWELGEEIANTIKKGKE